MMADADDISEQQMAALTAALQSRASNKPAQTPENAWIDDGTNAVASKPAKVAFSPFAQASSSASHSETQSFRYDSSYLDSHNCITTCILHHCCHI